VENIYIAYEMEDDEYAQQSTEERGESGKNKIK
jgi:hypothetical protein